MAACGTSALLADLSPSLQSISRADIRLFVALFVDRLYPVARRVGRRMQERNWSQMITTMGVKFELQPVTSPCRKVYRSRHD